MNFLKQLISDENGCVSSKRLAGLLCILALIFGFIYNTISPANKPSDALIDALALFAFGSFGLTSLDKYFDKKNPKPRNSEASN
jgi:hypothetical protein